MEAIYETKYLIAYYFDNLYKVYIKSPNPDQPHLKSKIGSESIKEDAIYWMDNLEEMWKEQKAKKR